MPRKSSSSVQVFYPRFSKKELIRRLQKGIKKLAEKLPLSFVVLFGSYARGGYTVASDVDLLIVYKGKYREDAFVVTKKTVDIPMLQPHVYSEEEFEGLKEVIERMTADGIVLFTCNKKFGVKAGD